MKISLAREEYCSAFDGSFLIMCTVVVLFTWEMLTDEPEGNRCSKLWFSGSSFKVVSTGGRIFCNILAKASFARVSSVLQ